MAAPGHGGSVNAVRGEDGEDVAFLPFEMRAQPCAELAGRLFDINVSVVAVGERAAVDDYGPLSVSVYQLKLEHGFKP